MLENLQSTGRVLLACIFAQAVRATYAGVALTPRGWEDQDIDSECIKMNVVKMLTQAVYHTRQDSLAVIMPYPVHVVL